MHIIPAEDDHILSTQTCFTMQEQMILRDEVKLWPGKQAANFWTNLCVTIHLGHLATKLIAKKTEGGVCVCVCVYGGGWVVCDTYIVALSQPQCDNISQAVSGSLGTG